MRSNAIRYEIVEIWANYIGKYLVLQIIFIIFVMQIKRNMMKYLEQFFEEKLKIKVLGKLTTTESSSGEEVGVSLVIDGYEPGIEVWYADYCAWLEEKIEKLESQSQITTLINGQQSQITTLINRH